MPEFDSSLEFRDIQGFPGYKIGNDGTVWTCKKRGGRKQWFMSDEWTIMELRLTSRGYLRVGLRQNGKCHWITVASLVLEAFVGPRPEGHVVRHFPDGTRTNNRLSNLQWSTQSENLADRQVHGTESTGMRNGKSKLKDDDIRNIRRLAGQGVPFTEIPKQLSLDVTPENVGYIVRGVTWKHID